jgi:ribosome maturation factor RimP
LSQLIADLEKLVAPALEADQVELVDLTYQKGPAGWTLVFYLDKAGGITLDDCEAWSDRLGVLVDESGLIERSYVLEVSSPGIDRALKKTKDFHRFAGERVHAKLFGPIEGQRNFHGKLVAADEENIRILSDEGREISIPRSQIAKCRLNPVIEI